MSDVHKVILIDEQKNTKETIQVSAVGSYEFENTELTGLWVDSDTGNLEVYIKNQPQLTIPQSVAVLLDERWKAQNRYLQRKVTVPRDALYNAVNPYDNELAGTSMGEWIDKNQNICFVYLAGKALGVNLVKVVEG